MMKETLTRQQTDHLFSLEVPECCATRVIEVYDCETHRTRFERYFTAMDLLRILPKTILVGGFKVNLMMDFEEDCVHVYYYAISGSNGYAKELVDALYKTIIFCIKNNHKLTIQQ